MVVGQIRQSLCLAAIGAALALLAGVAVPSTAGAAKKPCNGHPGLCAKTLNRVVLPGTHNSMSAEALDWNLPNQTYGIPGQLARGARAFLIDTYYGRQNPDGTVEDLSKAEGSESGAKIYLCHASCGGGASGLIEVFRQVRQFLVRNPREVLVFVNEDYVEADDFAAAVEESGLIDQVYEGPLDRWPTLNEMILRNDRVLFLAQSDAGEVPWYHRAYDGLMRETPYTFNAYVDSDTDLLIDPGNLVESCQPNRGGNVGGLFLMNHWILGSGVTPLRKFARVVNRKSVLVERARVCKEVRGKMPTILAVDFFGTGDVTGAALALNGLKPLRRLTPAQIRRKARALCKRKRGRARKACIRKQTARLKKQNRAIRA
ncbi:MAG: hypothetical protein ACO3ZZ_04205 [Solirubrobacterales bacterium]